MNYKKIIFAVILGYYTTNLTSQVTEIIPNGPMANINHYLDYKILIGGHHIASIGSIVAGLTGCLAFFTAQKIIENFNAIQYDYVFCDMSFQGYWIPINIGLLYTTLQYIGWSEKDYESIKSADLTITINNYSLLKSMVRISTTVWSHNTRLAIDDWIIISQKKVDTLCRNERFKTIGKKSYLGKVCKIYFDQTTNSFKATVMIYNFNEVTKRMVYFDLEVSDSDYTVIIII